jgi:hypothetical protein
MLFTQDKPLDEVLESLGKEKNIFLLACNGCAEACGTGGQEALSAMKTEVEKAGKKPTGTCLVDFLCNKVLVTTRLAREVKVVHPGANTVSLGGLQGLWPADERCEACGDCSLNYTGGICPVTCCAKGLLNGPCGGAQEGKCEVDPEKDCGWIKIYESKENPYSQRPRQDAAVRRVEENIVL